MPRIAPAFENSQYGNSVPTFEDLPMPISRGILAPDGWGLGGRCQWVLDTIFHMVERPHQPLRFNSVVLRTALDQSIFAGWYNDFVRDGVPIGCSPA